MNLEGTLALFPLRELIEMSVYSSVTGSLQLQGNEGRGSLFFQDGKAYHCTYNSLAGEAALTAMFELRDARFSFVADDTANEATLWGDIIRVMEHCQEQAGRWHAVRAKLPGTELVPYLISDPGVDNLSIERSDFAILSGIDGQRTLNEISLMLSLELIDVCESAVRLSEAQLLAFRPITSQTSSSSIRTASSTVVASNASGNATHSGSVIDRILATLPSIVSPSASDTIPTPSQPYAAHPPTIEEDPILRLLRG